MYNHLANGWQLAYMDYLIVLTSDLVHVHVSTVIDLGAEKL